MSALIEVPRLSDLDGLPVETVPAEVPGVVSVTGWANDGSVITLTWDETAGSVHVCRTQTEEVRLLVEREAVSRISVRENTAASSSGYGSMVEALAGSSSFG